ncbi:hypothetical protein MSP8886_01073 [Marinomonas spartinae]|uniref:PPPDE domain-containing protein n=1 Tax=Marinomonas spartinae TaxID=1792290 RepID=A0A1A8T6Q7_9GAMM|nr:hypothetical protein [Marinomonas spartinae]SBS28153.1 hypothetical protein MSP8886_01073 [Marinomonas spartinae]
MLKVYVWLKDDKNVGHASLSFGSNYVSFWPEDGAGKKDLKIKRSHPGSFIDALHEDIRNEGGRQPTIVMIDKIDSEKLEDFILDIQRNTPRYQLAKFNCSHVVADCLKVACGKEPSFQPSAQEYGRLGKLMGRGIWTPHQILMYAQELSDQQG